MNQLYLKLGSQIKGTIVKKITKTIDFFTINSDLKICFVKVDHKDIPFSVIVQESNYKIVHFEPIHCGCLEIEYEGIIYGKNKSYPYVNEKTTDEFYILRWETFYYPFFEKPNSLEFFEHLLFPTDEDKIELHIEMEDSRDYCSNAVRGGTFNPTISVGNYHQYETYFGSIFLLHENLKLVNNVEQLVHMTNDWLNQFRESSINNYKMIEIKDGYGSFVLPGTIFMTEEGFLQYPRLIHELIHTHWNPKVDTEIQRTRFFDEAFTQYLTYRVLDALNIQTREKTEAQYLETFTNVVNKYSIEICGIVDFAKNDLADLSYSLGALALIELEKKIGTACMNEILKKVLNNHQEKVIDFNIFESYFPKKAKKVFDDYFYTDVGGQKLLKSKNEN